MKKEQPTSNLPDLAQRAIAHIDGDAFFTSVEQALRPGLRGKPVVTGKERGIIACASYEAKARGIKRGVSLHEARRRCPSLVVLPGDYEAYSLFSERLMAILRRFSPKTEIYSIDEGFADLTGMDQYPNRSFHDIAAAIQETVRRELDITVSIGVSTTKSLAKIASDFRKPAGMTLVPPSARHDFLAQVPLGDVWGLGPSRVRLLQAQGLCTAADFTDSDEHWIRATLHKPGWDLWRELRGIPVLEIDTTPWCPRHSISKSQTFWPATGNPDLLHAWLVRHTAAAFAKLARYRMTASEITIILRRQDFKEIAAGTRLDVPAGSAMAALPAVKGLFESLYRPGPAYRATGIVLSRLGNATARQGDLFEPLQSFAKQSALSAAVADLKVRYGSACVVTATELLLDKTPKDQRAAAAPARLCIPQL